MDTEHGSRVDELIDVDFALRTAIELLPAGPTLTEHERSEHVEGLRQAAQVSTGHVQRVTGLDVSAALAHTSTLVVDRQGWAKANVQSFRAMLDESVTAALNSRKDDQKISTLSRRSTAAELGGLLAFLGTRVLGQYDPFGAPEGRLLLVAPTVVAVGKSLNVDAHDFRLWVCLHEETHRVQFAAAPWLRDYLQGHINELGTGLLREQGIVERLNQMMRQVPEVFGPTGSKQALDLIQTPEQRRQVDKVTAVMSLLEGHADVVMDEVGPQVIPSVASIRRKFNERRHSSSGFDQLIKRLLGLEAKMRQYQEGARFVRAVLKEVGHEGLNLVWESPDNLPELDEIAEPRRWLTRVQG
ncbi:zinc-dependent metalloprotease [Saxibacter everestensis]|uniref:Zinc-dependent metalloprotease n=1 Tax=Saxibacter everestensis TaxID=2909229 RepID=A0ABY8QPV8_9MICO|nr:zinc-dependent metalloprotease [Brevibacteriaceae bacterium ZFBP1038]